MAGGIRALAEDSKPSVAMMATQCIYAVMTLWAKAAFGRGTSPFVFVVYRQGFATLVLVPIAITAKRKRLKDMSLGVTGFFAVFVVALIGATANQYLCYQGLDLGSPSLSMALANLVPAMTFVIAAIVGQERVNIRELSSIAKVFGTIVCVGGAATMAFFKGPKLMNHSRGDSSAMPLYTSHRNWVMGALFQVGSCLCWSVWLILQGPICKAYADPLTLSAWTCLLSTLQSAMVAFFLLPDQSAWKLHSLFEISSCFFAGAFGSGVSFCLQAWCISVRGPLYSAMFSPLCAVITAMLAAIVLHEVLHIGSVLGAVAIIAGLYIVLWGKAKDAKRGSLTAQSKDLDNATAGSIAQLEAGGTLTDPREITSRQIELGGSRADQL